MTEVATPPTASRAAIQAIWTVAIGIVVFLAASLIVDLITGEARPTLDYAVGLMLSLGLKTVIWAIWVVAVAVRFREEPPRRRAQLATGAGLIVTVVDGLITIISSLGSGEFESALVTAVPLVIGIVVFIMASAAGAYGSIPLSAREAKSS
jgi:hypothetical protein